MSALNLKRQKLDLRERELAIELALAELGALPPRREPLPEITSLEFRGAALEIQSMRSEFMLSGPSETGKTISTLTMLHNLACRHPGAQYAIMRRTQKSVYPSVVKSFTDKVLKRAPFKVSNYGGEKPEWFDYPNGSRVWVGGMDNPSKILGQEMDGIYVNQAEELTANDWETLTTRTTGRAGNAPYSFTFGDCNPSTPTHWIPQRARDKKMRMFESRHIDNPSLFTRNGELTAQGKKTMAVLDALTGVRKERLRFGRWVQAEGAVYEFDAAVHRVKPFEIPAQWRRVRVVDFGYTNPFVCQWWAIDPDGRMYLYREIYRTQRLVSVHAGEILRLTGNERISDTIADHDAEDRATMHGKGINTRPAHKEILRGIELVKARLKVAGDGKPRLFVFEDCTVDRDEALISERKPASTEEEFASYIYPPGQDGRPIKEEPVKLNDHGMDAMRYAVAFVDGLGTSKGIY